MRISEKCRNNKHKNNSSDNPLTSCRTDGGKTEEGKNIKRKNNLISSGKPQTIMRNLIAPNLHNGCCSNIQSRTIQFTPLKKPIV